MLLVPIDSGELELNKSFFNRAEYSVKRTTYVICYIGNTAPAPHIQYPAPGDLNKLSGAHSAPSVAPVSRAAQLASESFRQERQRLQPRK